MRVPICRERSVLCLGRNIVSGRYPEKARNRWCFLKSPMLTNTQDRVYIFSPRRGGGGGEVTRNEHGYPLILWAWGGGEVGYY